MCLTTIWRNTTIQQQTEPGCPAGSFLFFISSRVFSSGVGIEAPPKTPRQCNCRDTISVGFSKWAGHGKGCPGGGGSGLSWRYLADGQGNCNPYPKQQIFHPALTKLEARVEWPSWRCKLKEYYVSGRDKRWEKLENCWVRGSAWQERTTFFICWKP